MGELPKEREYPGGIFEYYSYIALRESLVVTAHYSLGEFPLLVIHFSSIWGMSREFQESGNSLKEYETKLLSTAVLVHNGLTVFNSGESSFFYLCTWVTHEKVRIGLYSVYKSL